MEHGTINEEANIPGMKFLEYETFCEKFGITYESGIELNSRMDQMKLFLSFRYWHNSCYRSIEPGVNLYVPFNYYDANELLWKVYLL